MLRIEAQPMVEKVSATEVLYDCLRLAWKCERCDGLGHLFTSDGCRICRTCYGLRDLIRHHSGDWADIMPMDSAPGTRVIYHYGMNGSDYDVKLCRRNLSLGKTYTVDRTEIDSSTTRVYLREFPGVVFNHVMFKVAP